MTISDRNACVNVIEWDPTTRIELITPSPPAHLRWIAACWGIPPGLALGVACLLLPTPWPWLTVSVAFLTPCIFNFLVDRSFYCRRRFLFDIDERLTWTIGRRHGFVPLGDIRRIELRGLRLRTTFHPQSNTPKNIYLGRLAIRTSRRRLTIAYSLEELKGAEAEPYSELAHLQSRLANTLPNVEISRYDYRGGGVRWALDRVFMPWFEHVP